MWWVEVWIDFGVLAVVDFLAGFRGFSGPAEWVGERILGGGFTGFEWWGGLSEPIKGGGGGP